MTARRSRTRAHQPAWPQAVAVLVGVLFVIIGVVGFAATGLDGFAAHGVPDRLFGLAVNPLQNLVHLAIGVAGIVLSNRLPRTRVYGWVLVAGLGALFGYGVLVSRLPHIDVLNLNWPVNWLHLAFALVGLVIATGPVTARQPAAAASSS
ncbi:MAG TPA: DUF4383 domain-containing protein [Pseudonocardiaceae bacterium]|jgi:hypothetical protein